MLAGKRRPYGVLRHKALLPWSWSSQRPYHYEVEIDESSIWSRLRVQCHYYVSSTSFWPRLAEFNFKRTRRCRFTMSKVRPYYRYNYGKTLLFICSFLSHCNRDKLFICYYASYGFLSPLGFAEKQDYFNVT